MRKIFFCFLALIMIFSLSACSNDLETIGNNEEPQIDDISYNTIAEPTSDLVQEPVSEVNEESILDTITDETSSDIETNIEVYGRTNPAPVGVSQTITVSNDSREYIAKVTINSVERFASDSERAILIYVSEELSFTIGNENIEILHIESTVEIIKSENDKSVIINDEMFDIFSSDDVGFPRRLISKTDNHEVYAGALKTISLDVIIDKGTSPKIVFMREPDGSGGAWFSSYDESEPLSENDDLLASSGTIAPDSSLEPRENTNFRIAIWGDSPETVIAYETADNLLLIDNNITYNGKIANLDALIVYTFDPDKGLYKGLYSLNEEHSVDQIYITEYNNLKEFLVEKYGTPYEDEIITLNSAASYTDSGTALNYGYVAYRARWKTGDTEIMLAMMADNYDINTLIGYTSLTVVPDIDTSDF